MFDQIWQFAEPLLLSAISALAAWLLPKVAGWFDANSANRWVDFARKVIAEIVEEIAQISPPDLEGSVKKGTAKQKALRELRASPAAKAIEKATGAPLEDFVETSIEAAVFRKKLAEKATASVGKG